MSRSISFRAPSDEEGVCSQCASSVAAEDLDRFLWCPECVRGARVRARNKGRYLGLLVALGMIFYIGFVVRPDLSLIPVVWAAILVAAYYFGSRLGSEIFFALERTGGSAAVRGGR